MPTDLAAALDDAGQRATFDTLAYTHVRAINDAKTAETRTRRIAKVVTGLS